MTVTYGFYDSLAGDRKYNAEQMSALFEGIITEGIFQSVGGALVVSASSGMTVNVAAGRAWLFKTWTNNDSVLPLTLDPSEVALNRIDRVVVEINKDLGVRANAIKILKGTPASSPSAPALANTSTLKQFVLADIYVGLGVSSITGGNITNKIGVVGGTPFITGIVTSIDASTLLSQFEANFNVWFDNLQDELDANQASNLQNQIDDLTAKTNLMRYQIEPSVASNNLTINIKRLGGADPNAIEPIIFRVGNTLYNVISAISFTKNAGTNWCNLGGPELAAQPTDLFLYAIGETGASAGLKFGFSRIPYARVMSDFVNTTTDEKYISGNWTNFNASDQVTNIGRFRATLSAGAGYNWSIASSVVVSRPIFETDVLTCLSVSTGFSADYARTVRYKLIGDLMHYSNQAAAAGTSNTTGYTLSMPFKAKGSSVSLFLGLDNGAYSHSTMLAAANSNVLTLCKGASITAASWTASGSKACNLNFELAI